MLGAVTCELIPARGTNDLWDMGVRMVTVMVAVRAVEVVEADGEWRRPLPMVEAMGGAQVGGVMREAVQVEPVEEARDPRGQRCSR